MVDESPLFLEDCNKLFTACVALLPWEYWEGTNTIESISQNHYLVAFPIKFLICLSLTADAIHVSSGKWRLARW
jgi:hypothetical protein